MGVYSERVADTGFNLHLEEWVEEDAVPCRAKGGALSETCFYSVGLGCPICGLNCGKSSILQCHEERHVCFWQAKACK